MQSTINTYIKGIDQDTSPQKRRPETYYLLKDGHVVTEEGMTSGAIENEKGTTLAFTVPDTQNIYKLVFAYSGKGIGYTIYKGYVTIPTAIDSGEHILPAGYSMEQVMADLNTWYAEDILLGKFQILNIYNKVWFIGLNSELTVTTSSDPSNHAVLTLEVPAQTRLRIIGSATMRDEIILYTTNSTLETPGLNGQPSTYGQIWKFTFDEISKTVEGALITAELVPSKHLFYNNLLNFSAYNRVKKSITRYESEYFAKTYFTDGYNNLRHFNFNDPNHFILSPSELELMSDVDMTMPFLYDITVGGGLVSGRYQYCYQLYNTFGSATVVSPTSGLIDITSYNDKESYSTLYRGNVVDKDCGKTISIAITDIDARFSNIRVIRLQYKDLYADPLIRIIDEKEISGLSMIFSDFGDAGIGTLTRAEYTALGGKIFTAQTLEVKNSKLLAGNISEKNFDIDFDARCFRYRWDFVLGAEKTYSSNIVAGQESDDVNPYNTISNDNDKSSRYIYQKDKTMRTVGNVTNVRLGGTGIDQFSLGVPNIEYTFNMLALDGDYDEDECLGVLQEPEHFLPIGLNIVNKSWYNYKSSYISSHFRGYQRDEIYRFGIVFFDKKNRPGFVKWIGDIRMPAIADRDENYSDGYVTAKSVESEINKNQIYALYPTFTVNIPTAIIKKDQISGFSIVRVKRTGNDRTVIAQGILSRGYFYNTAVGRVQDWGASQFIVPIGKMFDPAYDPTIDFPHGYDFADYTFLSPEVNFNKNIMKEASDYFRLEAQLDYIDFPTGATNKTIKIKNVKSYTTTGIVTSDNLSWDVEVDNGTLDDFIEYPDTFNISELYNDRLTIKGTAGWGKMKHTSHSVKEIFHRNTSEFIMHW